MPKKTDIRDLGSPDKPGIDPLTFNPKRFAQLNTALPAAWKAALDKRAESIRCALYRMDPENNVAVYIANSLKMSWSVREPIEAVYDRYAQYYVREPGLYKIVLKFSEVAEDAPDIEIMQNLEPPILEKPSAPEPIIVEPEPEPSSDATQITEMFLDKLGDITEKFTDALNKQNQKIDQLAGARPDPKNDLVNTMITGQQQMTTALIAALTGNKSPVPADPLASLERIMGVADRAVDLRAKVTGPVHGAENDVISVLGKAKEIKDMLGDIFGENTAMAADVRDAAVGVAQDQKTWGTVLMSLAEKYGHNLMPVLNNMISRAVVEYAKREIAEAGHDVAVTAGASKKQRVIRAPVTLPASPAQAVPKPPAALGTVPATPPAPPDPQQEQRRLEFPSGKQIDGADVPAIPPQPEMDLGGLLQIMSDEFSRADYTLADPNDPSLTFANFVSDQLDEIIPDWKLQYIGMPVENAVEQLKGMIYAVRPDLQQHEEKLSELITELHRMVNEEDNANG